MLRRSFQQAGFQSAEGSIIATAGVGLVNVFMTVISIRLLDRVGRRPLLLASLGGMSFVPGSHSVWGRGRRNRIAMDWSD